ncbi:hypothetical protein ACWCPI_38150 [Streptomyces sp. NPDC001920]
MSIWPSHPAGTLPPRARPRCDAAIRDRVAAVVDVGLAAGTVTVFVMTKDGCLHRRHLRAEPAVTSPSSSVAAAANPAWTK